MELGNFARLHLLTALDVSQKSRGHNFATLRVARDLFSKIGFSADEIKELGLRQEDDSNYKWDSDKEVDFEFNDAERDVLKSALEFLSEKDAAGPIHLALYDALDETEGGA